MEIKNCEQYVLSLLRDREEEIASLQARIEQLKEELDITTERLAQAVNELQRAEDEQMHGNIENFT